MKPNRQRTGKTTESSNSHIATTGNSKVKKYTNGQRGPRQKTGPSVLPFNCTQVSDRQLPISEPCIAPKEATLVQFKSGQVNPSTKIKLQLFPVDEDTRIGLEKDGLNPFLELTLRARKKISSVIKHIHTKWGGSSIAFGELMLFPYRMQLGNPTTSQRWSLKDTGISAGDVYADVGSPAIFRLSYGWFSDRETQRGSESMQIVCTSNMDLTDEGKRPSERTEERQWLDTSETAEVAVTNHDSKLKMGDNPETSISPWGNDMTNLSIGGLLSEASLQNKIYNNDLKSSFISDISIGGLLSEASLQGKLCNNDERAPIQCGDSLTSLSIGGLLSEASLQAKINLLDPKSKQPSTSTCDSFDAIIASYMKIDPQMGKSSLESRSSILDAEETCNAFSFRKYCSSSKNVRISARASHESNSNSFRFPDLSEVDKQAGNAEDVPCQEPKTNLFSDPQHYGEDSRSLGLRGINWNESLGPFDLGLSMPWKPSGGDGTGFI